MKEASLNKTVKVHFNPNNAGSVVARGESFLQAAKMMTNFELSENADFMNNYAAALFLPHINTDEFPTVIKRLAKLQHKKSQQRIAA